MKKLKGWLSHPFFNGVIRLWRFYRRVSALYYYTADLIAIMRREIDELNVKPELELAIAHHSACADLMPSGKTKLKSNSRPVLRWNKALDENALGSQVEDSTVPAASIHIATSAQKVLKLGSITCGGTSTHGTHNNSPFAIPQTAW